ncbi:CPBP family intramembrane glutamic endopeptidase [Paractinoplanes rishiriensis]|uniref:CAAX prenyl protease 2/Lysostaphin resistance protein A-like domain-containing protein n=1 Tax=Paractinoplanes rishiriensis TaxID=1050105 RepID=A0A919K952_9ACTN|nr:type II CAAX endopeptidase family protein [Actinoplanes rishiriensis]GIF00993.1 hypothetical protein Ari01nite_84570 [Actinoplanes rishiriensis]
MQTSMKQVVARHPITALVVIVFSIAYPAMFLVALATHRVIPGGDLIERLPFAPDELAGLLLTAFALLPAAVFVTWAADGRAGVRQLFRRAVRWRFPLRYWLLALTAIPVLTVAAGLLLGDTWRPDDPVRLIPVQLGQLLINLLLVNLWEETAWAGVVQTRLEQRHSAVVAGLITAVPFGLVHWPLAFIGDFTLTSVLVALPAYVLLGTLVRPLGGLVMRGAGGSVLAFALLHTVFNRTNNPNGIVAAVLHGSAYQIGILTVLLLLTVTVALAQRDVIAFIRRHPHAFFLIVFSTLGQAAAFVPVIAHRVYGADWNIELYLILPTLLFLLLPALVITRIARGADGLRELARSMVRFRVHPAWYLLPLVAVPALTLLTALPAPSGVTAAEAATAYVTVFLPALAFQFLTTNLWEETVWTGFFQGPLQDRFGPWRAVLLTTPFFALQHLSLVFGGTFGQGLAQFGLILVAAFFTRVLLGWIYQRTRSVALAGLVHAAANAAGIALVPQLFRQPGGGGTALLLLGLVVILTTLAASAVTTRKGLRHA